MLCQSLIHLKHVNGVNIKKAPKSLITYNLSPIIRVLQIVFSDIRPKLLDNLKPLKNINQGRDCQYTKLPPSPFLRWTNTKWYKSLTRNITSVLANSDSPTKSCSSGERLHNLVKPPPLRLDSSLTLFNLIISGRCTKSIIYRNLGMLERHKLSHLLSKYSNGSLSTAKGMHRLAILT